MKRTRRSQDKFYVTSGKKGVMTREQTQDSRLSDLYDPALRDGHGKCPVHGCISEEVLLAFLVMPSDHVGCIDTIFKIVRNVIMSEIITCKSKVTICHKQKHSRLASPNPCSPIFAFLFPGIPRRMQYC